MYNSKNLGAGLKLLLSTTILTGGIAVPAYGATVSRLPTIITATESSVGCSILAGTSSINNYRVTADNSDEAFGGGIVDSFQRIIADGNGNVVGRGGIERIFVGSSGNFNNGSTVPNGSYVEPLQIGYQDIGSQSDDALIGLTAVPNSALTAAGGNCANLVSSFSTSSINQDPTVTASADQTIDVVDFSASTPQRATVTASFSDPDVGDNLTATWTQISGPTTPVSTTQSSVARGTTSRSFDQPSTAGTAVYEVTVNDGNGGTATDTVSVVWQAAPTVPANQAPTADAGPDQTGTIAVSAPRVGGAPAALSAGVRLDGTGSSDPDANDTLSYDWVLLSGPQSSFSNASKGVTNSEVTVMAPTTTGTQVWRLTVTDNAGATDTDEVSIVWSAPAVPANQAPTVTASADQTISADFSGNGTVQTATVSAVIADADGDSLTSTWTQLSGPASAEASSQPSTTSSSTSRIFEQPASAGTAVYQVSVDDGNGGVTMDTVSVVWEANQVPTITAPVNQDPAGPVAAGATVTLSSGTSVDPDGGNVTYLWTQTSGPSVTLDDPTSPNPSFAAPSDSGTVVFELTVSDGISSTSQSISVDVDVNEAPTANAGADQQGINEGDLVTLTAAGSTDPENDTLTYSWSQVSGPSVVLSSTTAQSPTFIAPDISTATTLVFSLTVNDGMDDSTIDQVSVSILPRGTITIIQTAQGGDSNFGFSSDIAGLNGTVFTQNGSGQLSASNVAAGTFTVTAVDTRAAGFALTDINCDDDDTTVDLTNRAANIVLAPGEDIVCTFASVNSRGAARSAINNFITQRSTLILSNGPDRARRFNRLDGRAGSERTGLHASGLTVPGTDKLPINATISDRDASFSSSWAQVRNKGGLTTDGTGSVDVWVQGQLSQFDSLGRDGDFSVVHVGADVLVNDNLLVGAVASFDQFDVDGDANGVGEGDGNGFLIGPYATARIGSSLYLDGRVQYGTSNNRISPLGTFESDFDTDRILGAASITGDFGLANGMKIQPTLEVRHLSEQQETYVDALGVTINEDTFDFGEVSFAPRVEHSVPLNDDWVANPFGQVEGIYSYGDNPELVLGSEFRARVEGGVKFLSIKGVDVGVSGFADGLGASSYASQGVRVSLSYTMK